MNRRINIQDSTAVDTNGNVKVGHSVYTQVPREGTKDKTKDGREARQGPKEKKKKRKRKCDEDQRGSQRKERASSEVRRKEEKEREEPDNAKKNNK